MELYFPQIRYPPIAPAMAACCGLSGIPGERGINLLPNLGPSTIVQGNIYHSQMCSIITGINNIAYDVRSKGEIVS